MRARLSMRGLWNEDPTVLDEFQIPQAINVDVLKDNLMLETMELEVLYPDPAAMKWAIGRWSRMRKPVWDHLVETTEYEYNPIWNYDRTEERTLNRSYQPGSTLTISDLQTAGGSNTTTNSGSDIVTAGGSDSTTGSKSRTDDDDLVVSSELGGSDSLARTGTDTTVTTVDRDIDTTTNGSVTDSGSEALAKTGTIGTSGTVTDSGSETISKTGTDTTAKTGTDTTVKTGSESATGTENDYVAGFDSTAATADTPNKKAETSGSTTFNNVTETNTLNLQDQETLNLQDATTFGKVVTTAETVTNGTTDTTTFGKVETTAETVNVTDNKNETTAVETLDLLDTTTYGKTEDRTEERDFSSSESTSESVSYGKTETTAHGHIITEQLGETLSTARSEVSSGEDVTEDSEDLHAYGNIGVTTTQQMIQQEREIALFNVMEVIITEFKARFCICVY